MSTEELGFRRGSVNRTGTRLNDDINIDDDFFKQKDNDVVEGNDLEEEEVKE